MIEIPVFREQRTRKQINYQRNRAKILTKKKARYIVGKFGGYSWLLPILTAPTKRQLENSVNYYRNHARKIP